MDLEREDKRSTAIEAVNHPIEDQIHDYADKQKASSSSSSSPPPLPPPPPPPAASRWKSLHKLEWFWECMCGILVLATVAAMFSVIATAQDQPVAAWRQNHSSISINAVVAVLSALLKGTCMYIVAEVIGQTKWQWFGQAHRLGDFERIDNASRGPWGSAKLLCRIRAPKLALLGAFITVVALAVDPFTQNIIAVRNCQIPSTNQTALIPTADTYNSWIGGIQRNNTSPNPGDFILWGINRFVPDSDIIASAYSGLFSSATTVIKPSAIRSSCPGINCTFQRYSTLGVCHRCANISSSVETVCSPSPPAQENIFRPRCKWSLPSGQMLQNYTESDNLLNGTIAEVFINFAIANSTASTVALPHVPGTFTNVTILANVTMDPKCTITSENDCGNSAGVPNMDFGPIAFECSLFPCTRTYTASVIGGAIVETEVKRSFGQGNWLNDRGDSSKALSPDKVQINPNEDCTSKWPHKDGSPPPCTYTAGPEFIMSLGNFFWSFWNGTSTGRHYGEATSTNDAMAILYSGGVTNFTHIDRVLGAMADSMTAAIRLTGRVDSDSPVYGRGQGKVEGQVMLADTCIDVRWGWIALPAAVALLTLLLLIPAVVLGRAARSQPAWKSSALAVLFHGLDDTAELASKAPLLTAAEMEKEARGLWVRLSDETGGALRLKTQRRPRIDGD